jgi:hypothetical protein
MSVALADLVTRLQADIPARSSVPSESQYEQCVKDAAADYSRRRKMQKMTTLNIVSGTATYDLPDDFLRLIKLERSTVMDGNVIIANEGLIPVSSTYEERHIIAGGQITFYPTPTYSQSRDLWYAAGHVLDGDEEYPDMTEDDAGIVLLKAAACALRRQANAAASGQGNVVEYQIGDERVKKSDVAGSLRSQANDMEREYLAAVEAAVGALGVRASYNLQGK